MALPKDDEIVRAIKDETAKTLTKHKLNDGDYLWDFICRGKASKSTAYMADSHNKEIIQYQIESNPSLSKVIKN
jgi:hypothetical protein